MKLWQLVKADSDYGKTYQAIVAADTEFEARLVMGRTERGYGHDDAFDWVDDKVTVAVEIGTSNGTETEVIMTKESAG